MTLFQIFCIVFVGVALLFSRMQGKSIFIRAFFLLMLGAVVLLVMYPGISIQVAHFFGIGRGVDFFIYISISFLLFGYFRIYYHLLKQEEKITLLVRHAAIQEALSMERSKD